MRAPGAYSRKSKIFLQDQTLHKFIPHLSPALKYIIRYKQSPKNVGNLGTGFLRKVSKSEEGLTRISRINVAKTDGKV